jgi:hypothetical protein
MGTLPYSGYNPMKMNGEGTTAQHEMPGCWVTRASCNDLGRARSTLSELCRQEN